MLQSYWMGPQSQEKLSSTWHVLYFLTFACIVQSHACAKPFFSFSRKQAWWRPWAPVFHRLEGIWIFFHPLPSDLVAVCRADTFDVAGFCKFLCVETMREYDVGILEASWGRLIRCPKISSILDALMILALTPPVRCHTSRRCLGSIVYWAKWLWRWNSSRRLTSWDEKPQPTHDCNCKIHGFFRNSEWEKKVHCTTMYIRYSFFDIRTILYIMQYVTLVRTI